MQDESEATFVSCVLWAFGVPEDAYKLGRTRVFFRAGQLQHIQQILQVRERRRKRRHPPIGK